MRTAIWDSADPELHFDNPNLRWGAPVISSSRAILVFTGWARRKGDADCSYHAASQ